MVEAMQEELVRLVGESDVAVSELDVSISHSSPDG